MVVTLPRALPVTASPPHESGLIISRNWRDIRAGDRRIRVFLPCQRWHVRPVISVPPEETADWYADAFQDTGSAGGHRANRLVWLFGLENRSPLDSLGRILPGLPVR